MKYEYDDPYTFLTWHLLYACTDAELDRILKDNDYIKKLIRKEVRDYDLRGPFTDAVVETILLDKKRMELMKELDKLSKYYYDKLDIERLRNKIIEYRNLYNIM